MGILKSLFGGDSSRKESSDTLFKQAEASLQAGNYASALTLFSQMLKQAETEGAGKKMRNQLYDFACAVHNGAVHLNNKAGGNIYFSAGLAELDVEISIMEMLLKYEPTASDVWSGLGLAYDNRGHCKLAETCYRKAIELDPNGVVGADTWMNIGVLYMNYAKTIGDKDHEIPLAGLRKEQLFPTEGSVIAINGNFNSPHWETAKAAFEQALSIYTRLASTNAQYQPDLANAHWNLAQLYTFLLQGSKAIPHVQAVFRLQPGNQKAIDWLREAEQNTGQKLL